jgi:BirA family transcriptional regulator, biotin operon repressor / biotin---[acetyl-CoA-carboxylase] ligase
MSNQELFASAVMEGLATQFIGRRVVYYPRLASTMDTARSEAGKGAPEGTVIVTGEQTAGRGRLKRTWLTPENGLAFSVVLYPAVARLPGLIMVASLAVVQAIEGLTGLKPGIKWPNDILINGKKVCGILIENSIKGEKVFAVIGIGINVNLRTAGYPDIAATATSLNGELGREVSRLDLVRRVLAELEPLYLSLDSGEAVFTQWRDSLVTLGQNVTARSGETLYQGVAESVARDGGLLLRQADGNLIKVVAGDVTLRR